jgi:hypothetical protein
MRILIFSIFIGIMSCILSPCQAQGETSICFHCHLRCVQDPQYYKDGVKDTDGIENCKSTKCANYCPQAGSGPSTTSPTTPAKPTGK